MKVKMILPALTEATSPFFRPIKYSLFPPLGLATLAAYAGPDDEVTIHDEHVEALDLDVDADLVVIQAYVTSAYRAYEIADHFRGRGVHVAMGGLHPTALPEEAALHARVAKDPRTAFAVKSWDRIAAAQKELMRRNREHLYADLTRGARLVTIAGQIVRYVDEVPKPYPWAIALRGKNSSH